jgi:hypothetical protein
MPAIRHERDERGRRPTPGRQEEIGGEGGTLDGDRTAAHDFDLSLHLLSDPRLRSSVTAFTVLV